MKYKLISKAAIAFVFAMVLVATTAGRSFAQGQGNGNGNGNSKKDEKQLNKEANKTANKAEEAANELGRDSVFCILAAHTTGVGTAQQLRDKFNALQDFPFGQFVAAVLLADRIDKPLDEILMQLQDGKSIGKITREADVNMGDVRQGYGQFRSELAHSMTNPPTKNCFQTT